jgi:hypothetical protein
VGGHHDRVDLHGATGSVGGDARDGVDAVVRVAEHLYAAGFAVTAVIPRFLPYSFRGSFPASPGLTRTYLHCPVLWQILGKQFLVLGVRPG